MTTTLNTEEIKSQIELLNQRIKELNKQILEGDIQFELKKKEALDESKEAVKDYEAKGLGLSLPEEKDFIVSEGAIFTELAKIFKLDN